MNDRDVRASVGTAAEAELTERALFSDRPIDAPPFNGLTPRQHDAIEAVIDEMLGVFGQDASARGLVWEYLREVLLRAAQRPEPCPYLVTGDEGTVHCRLAESSAQRPGALPDLLEQAARLVEREVASSHWTIREDGNEWTAVPGTLVAAKIRGLAEPLPPEPTREPSVGAFAAYCAAKVEESRESRDVAAMKRFDEAERIALAWLEEQRLPGAAGSGASDE